MTTESFEKIETLSIYRQRSSGWACRRRGGTCRGSRAGSNRSGPRDRRWLKQRREVRLREGERERERENLFVF